MPHISVERVAIQAGSSFLRAPRRWASLLLLVLLALPGLAQAVCSDMNVPDSYTTPATSPMASGGTITINAGTRCDPFGLNPYPSGGTTLPSHGTVTVVSYSGTITYVNNGDGATSDSFVVADASAHLFTVNVAIAPAGVSAPVAGNVSASVAYGSSANPIALALSGGTASSVSVASAASHGTAVASGTSISYTPAARYVGPDSFTYTATNSAGTSAAATVNVTVNATPPSNLVYLPASYIFTKGQPSATAAPTYNGAPLTTCTVSPALPTGLSIDTSDCAISGTPMALSTTPVGYTVTAANSAGSTTALVTITVNDVAPSNLVYTPGSYTFTQGQAITPATPTYTGGLMTSCTASPALPTGLSISPGNCTISGTPTVSAPSSSYTVIASNSGGSATAMVTINVLPAAPTVANASMTAAYNTAATIDLTSSITGTNVTGIAIGTGPLHGTTTVSGKTVTYTPSPTYYGGSDSFTYTATNPGGTSTPATVTITVTPPAAPTVANASMTAAYNTAASIDLTSSITGADVTGITVGTGPSHGTATVSGETVTYTPASNYYGSDSFTYTATNPGGTSTPATVTITVTPPSAPTVANASMTAAYNTAATIDLASSITGTDVTGIAIGTAPAHGTVSVSGLTATYTPSSTYYGGPDSFTYIAVNPGGTSTPATVTITVGGPTAPTAAAKSVTTAYNTTATIDLSSSITGVDITAVTIGSAPAHGTVSVSGKTVTYTPSSTYYGGADSFTYTATNPGGTSAPATVTITVGVPAAPTAAAKSVTTAYNTAATIDLSSSITGVGVTTVTIGSAPVHGIITVSGKTVTYTPSSTFYGGSDSFVYSATNPGGTSAPATVSITVGMPGAPTAAAKSVATAYNTPATIDLSGSITGVDITGITIATAPAHGTVSVSGKTVTYTPSSTYYGGSDIFTYTTTNPGGTSAPATVTITVGVPAAPTAAAKSVTTAYNTAATIDLSSSIIGVDVTAVTIGSAPTHGTISVSGKTVTYTPSSSYYGGTDSFTYTATNPGGTSAPATVSITVGVPTAPTAAAKSVTTAYNTAATIGLSSSITGVDVTAVTIGSAPAHGTVSVSGKTVTYTPSSTFYGGSDSFTYTATNPGGTSAPATVSITVGLPAAPTGAAKSVSTAYNTAAAIDLSGSITGVDITAVTIGNAPAHGTVSVSGQTVTYTPSSTYYGGNDSFTYTATNPGGTSAPATVTITVGLPPVPTAAARNATTAYNTAASIDLSAAITGVDITAVAIASAPSHGTVSVSGKTVTYTPSPTFYGGSDRFTYTATNPGGTSAPATVTMTVTPLSVPTAQALSVTTTTGTSVQIQATAGATGPAPFTGARVATAPAHGNATASGEQITYTPTAGFIGTDHFTYQIANHFGASTAATVTVTVTAAGQASAPNGTVTLTTKPGEPVSTNLGNIVTGQFVSATVLGLSPSGAGQVSISQLTTLTFTSVAGFHGLAQITVLLTAADGHTATVDVLVLVSNQPDPSKNPDVLGLINAQTMEAQRFADSQLGNIQQRLESVRDGNDRLFSSTLSLNQDGRSPQASGAATVDNRLDRSVGSDSNPYDPNGVAVAARPGPGVEGAARMMQSPDASGATSAPAAVQDEADHAPPSRGSNGLGTWIDVSADFGSFDAYRQAAGFDADVIAISTGIDRRLGEYSLLGLSLGYNHDRSAIGDDGTRSTARGYSAAVYGSFAPSAKTYIDAILGGGGLSFDSRRRASNSDSYLFGQRDGKQWFGSVTAGYEYRHAHWLLSPYGRLQWSYSNLDGFAESGDVIDALAYGRQSVRTTVAVLGLRTSWMVVKDQTILIPRVRLEVGHNFQGASDTTLNYAFVPSAGSWNVLTNPYSANGNSVLAGLGLDIQLPRGMTLTTDYNFLMQPHSHNQLIRLGVQTKF